MSVAAYTARALKHWKRWLPEKVAELKAQGRLNSAAMAAAKRADERVIELMQQGYRQHEAEEVAMSEHILLAPESGAGLEDWEVKELKKLDEEFRRNPPITL